MKYDIKKLVIYGSPLAIIFIVFFVIYVVVQQDIRQGANDPQIQLAEDGATQMEAGIPPSLIIPAETIDLEKSLSPFVVVFDDSGKPLSSSGSLQGTVPIPPKGIFDNARRFGEVRLTWEPLKGVREAMVMKSVGSNSGFVMAARSLREVEQRENYLSIVVLVAFIGSMLLALFAMFFHYKLKKS